MLEEDILIKLKERSKKLEELKKLTYDVGKKQFEDEKYIVERLIKGLNLENEEKLIKKLSSPLDGVAFLSNGESREQRNYTDYIESIGCVQNTIKLILSEYEIIGLRKRKQSIDNKNKIKEHLTNFFKYCFYPLIKLTELIIKIF